MLALGAAVLFLLAAMLSVAHLSAVHAQRAYEHMVHLIAEPGVYRAVERTYHRGWFSSDAVTELTIDGRWLQSVIGADTDGRPLTLLLDHHIQHGPLLFPRHGGLSFGVALVSTQLDLSPPAMRQLRTLFPNGIPFSSETRIDFTGATDTEMQVPRGALPAGFDGDHQALSVAWDGLAGSLITSPDLTHFEVALDSGGIRVSGPFGKLRLLSATGAGQADRGSDGRWGGRQQVSVQGIDLRNSHGSVSDGLHIESAGVVAIIEPDGNSSHTQSQWRMQRIRLGGTQVGELGAKVTVDHLDGHTLRRLARRVAGTASASSPAGTEPPSTAATRTASPDTAPSLTVQDLRMAMADGTIGGHFSLVYHPDTAPNSADILSGITGQGTLSAPEALVQSVVENYVQRMLAARAAVDPSIPTDPAIVAQQTAAIAKRHIAKLLHEHMVLQDGQQFTSTLKFEHGNVTAGGKAAAMLLPELSSK
ncbi:MAG: DUF945 family protein [Gammaproteobacteria bacterium]